jgi:hypothetical protein
MKSSKKPYTWNEIKDFLIKELGKTKHIMTFGTIGSCNVENDIDTIITKKPKSKSSEFYKEIHNLFDNLNDYLNKKYNAKAIRFSKMEEEYLIQYLGRSSKNDLLLHTMIYTSYNQIEKDWGWALFEGENIKKILLQHYKTLFGKTKNIFTRAFSKKNYCDPIFIFLYLGDKINSNFPDDLLLKVMNHSYDYFFRKRLGIKTPVAKNKKQVKEIFYKLCDKLDELNSKKIK